MLPVSGVSVSRGYFSLPPKLIYSVFNYRMRLKAYLRSSLPNSIPGTRVSFSVKSRIYTKGQPFPFNIWLAGRQGRPLQQLCLASTKIQEYEQGQLGK
jgi:hypothetical protein